MILMEEIEIIKLMPKAKTGIRHVSLLLPMDGLELII